MAVDPVSVGLAGLNLVKGIGANKAAKKQANKAAKDAKNIEKRMTGLFDLLLNRATQADKQGTFDPEKRIKALEDRTAGYEARDASNLAGAMRVAGYRPGDSEIGTRQDAVKIKYRRFLDEARDNIRTQSWWDQQNAYLSANPNYLNAALEGARGRQSQALGKMQNPGDFLSLLMAANRPSGTSSNQSLVQGFRLGQTNWGGIGAGLMRFGRVGR